MKQALEQYFEFARLGTTWRTEILAGCTTFLTMAYIIFVNPSILAETGMPFAAVMTATCLSSAVGSLLMGAWARYPIALAPGMGLNAYFTYSVCKGMGIAWPVALGAVFFSGVAFLLLTLGGVRQLIIEAIPRELYAAVAGGIGLFIAFIGLKNAGLVVAHPATFVTLGNLRQPAVLAAMAALLVTAVLMAWAVRAAMLLGVLTGTVIGFALGLVQWNPRFVSPAELSATFFQLDLAGAARVGVWEIIFVFLFVDLFDNIGTLLAVGKKAGLFVGAERVPRMQRILLSDSLATMAGSLTGTSTVVSYIESASGVVAGGRSGVTAVVTGLLFVAALGLAPLVGAVPAAATAPALIIVGALMASHVTEIDWADLSVAVPAFLTLVMIPLTFSIANGLAFGYLSYVLIQCLRGRARQMSWMSFVLAALFLLRFAYLGAA
jgi:AGZA family xanthine/uracil permease-like MFS transporter